MATLYQRDGTFYVNYSINDQRIRKAVGKDRKRAEIYLSELRYKLSNGDISPKKPEIPIRHFIEDYLKDCRTRLTENSCLRYREVMNHFLNYLTNEQPTQFINQITKGSLLGYITYRQRNRRKPKNSTVNVELTVIRAALNWAYDRDWIDKNPATRMKMLKTNDSKQGQIINEQEVELLIEGCNQIKEGLWFKDILIVFLNTGMRLGELINLTWDDIDLNEMVIKIQKKPFWKPKSSARDIPINDTVNRVLVNFCERPRDVWVFSRDGKKIMKNEPRLILIKVAKKVGLDHITRVHDLRHSFASNLLMKGVDIPTVAALLGHQSISTTLIYSHQTKEHKTEAIKILDRMES